MSANLIKICLVDDHPMMVEGLKEVLSGREGYLVTGELYDGEQLMSYLVNQRPDVIVLDINMPGLDGISCTKLIKKQYPDIRVIILTMHSERLFLNQLIAVGADGCVLKSRGSKDLILAIDRVMNNKSYFDTVSNFRKADLNEPVPTLSEREVQIVKLVTEGFTSSDIADRLCITENTVKTHRKNIFRKLGINHNSQLTRYAISNKII